MYAYVVCKLLVPIFDCLHLSLVVSFSHPFVIISQKTFCNLKLYNVLSCYVQCL